MSAVIRQVNARREQCYYWATHAGAELDLLIVQGQNRWGLEFKRTSAPKITRSPTPTSPGKATRFPVGGDKTIPAR